MGPMGDIFRILREVNSVWQKVAQIIDQLKILVRVVLNDGSITEWGKWFVFPSDGYGEVARYGPFQIKDVCYIEVNPVEHRKVGRLLPEKEIDHSEELESALAGAGIVFEIYGGKYRIFNPSGNESRH